MEKKLSMKEVTCQRCLRDFFRGGGQGGQVWLPTSQGQLEEKVQPKNGWLCKYTQRDVTDR